MTKRRGPDTYRRLRRAKLLRERLSITGRRGRDFMRKVRQSIAKRSDPKARIYVKAEALRSAPK